MGKNGRMIQNGTVMQKQNSGTKNGTVVQKRNSGSKTHWSVFCSILKRTEQKCKNGTVVQKHTVLLWKKQNSSAKKRNSGAKTRNSDTKTHSSVFCSVVEKTEQCYKNTLFREKTEKVVQKNGSVVRKHGTVIQKHTVPFFCSVVKKKTEKKCKNSRGTKTHCSVFVPLW